MGQNGGTSTHELVAIEAMIHDLLRERLSKRAVNKVVVRAEHDHDGDPVLQVVVVLEGRGLTGLKGHKVIDVVRAIHDRLEAEQIEEFPMIRFVPEHDAEELLGAG